MKALIVGTVILGVLLAGASFVAAAPRRSIEPAATGSTPVWPYALYGDAIHGWSLTAAPGQTPGPNIIVTTGDILALHLFSADGSTHNWTIDANNDSRVQPSEVQSTDFNSTTGPIWFNFTVALSPGTYTYRCGFHSSVMWGELVVNAAPTYTLWGSAAAPNGWGFASNSIAYPGPRLNVSQGQTVSVDLFSADGVDHTFYVDFAASGSASGNTASPVFNASHAVRFTFVASPAGDFVYGCGIHGQATMKGPIHVAASSTPTASPDFTIYAAVILVVVILAVAAMFVIRRKPKAPPPQPPK
jgi:plastocyanin